MTILILGAGDLATGVAARLFRCGFRILMTELPHPLAVRRFVSFAEAVYRQQFTVEEITAVRVQETHRAAEIIVQGNIPILVDPQATVLLQFRSHLASNQPLVVVDARMTKRRPPHNLAEVDFLIGLGPGFTVGENCHAIIETNRGHQMGRVLWEGSAQPDTGIPESVIGHAADRVLRAPCDGEILGYKEIGERVEMGEVIAEVAGCPVAAPFAGVLRGLLHPGLWVKKGAKIGDVDPRGDPRMCRLISDKSLAIGGGVLEAILSKPELRAELCTKN